jgi:hypothetical protein
MRCQFYFKILDKKESFVFILDKHQTDKLSGECGLKLSDGTLG